MFLSLGPPLIIFQAFFYDRIVKYFGLLSLLRRCLLTQVWSRNLRCRFCCWIFNVFFGLLLIFFEFPFSLNFHAFGFTDCPLHCHSSDKQLGRVPQHNSMAGDRTSFHHVHACPCLCLYHRVCLRCKLCPASGSPRGEWTRTGLRVHCSRAGPPNRIFHLCVLCALGRYFLAV